MSWTSRAGACSSGSILTCRSTTGSITDDAKIRACLPTLTALLNRDAAVVACSHLGRPGGVADMRYTLAPVARRLAVLLHRPVTFAADSVGPAATSS